MKNDHKSLKARAWKLMSEYVRRRDKGICFTCGEYFDWRYDMDAGHFKHGRLDFDDMNIHAQCKKCNKHKHGDGTVYYEKMIEKYGVDKVMRLTRLANQSRKYTIIELKAIIIDLKQKISILKKNE